MKCEQIGFVGCKCADCVYNPHYALNTPKPCVMASCDVCEKFNCEDVFTTDCSGHLTIAEVNEMIER